jgi:ubiquinone/menaquinone biosynthesis C-methylase UbiE
LLYALLRHHDTETKLSDRDADLVRIMTPMLAHDPFSLSQYLLGLEYFEGRLERLGLRGQRVVDVACGVGNWALAAARRSGRVVGVDIRADRLSVAQQLAQHVELGDRVTFLQASASALPVSSASMDACICTGSFPFFPDHLGAAQEFRRVVRKGGMAYVTVTHVGHLVHILRGALQGHLAHRGSAWVRVMAKNVLYCMGLRQQPASFASRRYVAGVFERAGWAVAASGPEGSLGNDPVVPLFQPTYAGLPYMTEFICVAI